MKLSHVMLSAAAAAAVSPATAVAQEPGEHRLPIIRKDNGQPGGSFVAPRVIRGGCPTIFVQWDIAHKGAFVQVNLDGLPARNVDNNPNDADLNHAGDALLPVGRDGMDLIVPSEPYGKHTITVWVGGPNVTLPETSIEVDCGPAPVNTVTNTVEVPVVHTVQVPVDRERIVIRTKRVRANCDLKIKNGKKIFYNCRKPVKRAKPKAKRPGAVVEASRTRFTA